MAEHKPVSADCDPPWSCPKCPWIHHPHPVYGWAAHDTRAIEVHRTRLCPARAGSARTLAEARDEGWLAAQEVVDFEDTKVWAHTVFPEGCEGNPYRPTSPGQISTRGLDTSQPRPTTPGQSLRDVAREHGINPVGTDLDIETGKRVTPPGDPS